MTARLGRFRAPQQSRNLADPRREALGHAVCETRVVWLKVTWSMGVMVHLVELDLSRAGWMLVYGLTGQRYPEAEWGNINISARQIAAAGP